MQNDVMKSECVFKTMQRKEDWKVLEGFDKGKKFVFSLYHSSTISIQVILRLANVATSWEKC